ncbi:DUF4386 domain-containing protein [Pseudoflavitalea sp. G-6-1-2]|uniref:DUF4386 domain-containing protein n=1 Tax=Pseudoflavitalea sp. G-6-1-2 TaxID=2728841 RepID=UPI00146D018E|nr:DUF4386 domain-containing protein [Pseudoflavitalea sp. G-6-1-2]NML20860.1 DUF4386 domain-containing protein [Pseudoflavitalea sp. G-6-1-2]
MNPNKRTARLAGAFYLGVVIFGIFSIAYVPSQLIRWKDAAQTLQNIQASESLFRWGIAGGVGCYLCFTLLPLTLYRLLKPVHEHLALLMTVLALLSVPVSFLNLQHKFDVLSLLHSGASYGVSAEQLQQQVMLHLVSYSNGVVIAQVFWGLWLLPFGYLVYRSGFLPKILGVLLMLGCAGYMFGFLIDTVFPGLENAPWVSYVRLPATIGEIGTCLWLLIIGVNAKKLSLTK